MVQANAEAIHLTVEKIEPILGNVLGATKVSGKDDCGEKHTFTLFEDRIENLPGGSRHNLRPGIEMEVMGDKAKCLC